MTLVLDNTVMSNFALVGRNDLLSHFVADIFVTTEAAWDELQRGVTLGRIPEDDQLVTLAEGNSILQQMIGFGYRCPVQSL